MYIKICDIYMYVCVCIYTHTHNGILIIKMNEILPFATAGIELEGIAFHTKWNKPGLKRQIPYNFTYM